MAIIKRRLLFWLIKAYIKKWSKRILFFFILGLTFFFILITFLKWILPKIPAGQKEIVGIVGAYTSDNIPSFVLKEVSFGLTTISSDGYVKPGIAEKWEIKDKGKTYIFYLKNNLRFSDRKKIESKYIEYKFSDAKIERPNQNTIVFKLKESFSPFLVTVSKPVFKKGFIGVGEYKITDIKLNGNFIKSVTLTSVKDRYNIKKYQFYPTFEALKHAYLLGEISKMKGLTDISYKDLSFKAFPNTDVKKTVSYDQIVAIFYNTKDPVLSDKKIRNALTYAVPESLEFGQRAYNPYSEKLWVYTGLFNKEQDLTHSKLLLTAANGDASKSASLNLEIKTLPKYEKAAKVISAEWKKVGVNTKIEIIESVPNEYQIFLGDFYLPADPDQYMLWHSDQEYNITGYENKRIDKLLEDGRKTTSSDERKKIYNDFQKYLLDDSPATFLYFPYEYEISRK